MKIEHHTCVVCGSSKIRLFLQIVRSEHVFDIVKCQDCGMVFVRNPLAESNYDASVASSAHSVEDRQPKPRHYYLLSILKSLPLCASARILEIGSGYGELGRVVAKGFGRSSYFGIEPSPIRASHCSLSGLTVYETTLSRFSLFPQVRGQFDVVVVDNVLEHLYLPREAIRQIRLLLKPVGYLIVVVPNLFDFRRYLQRRFRTKEFWIPRCHLNYFSKSTLRFLLETEGFEIYAPFVSVGEMAGKEKVLFTVKIMIEKYLKVFPLGLYFVGRKAK